MVYFFKGRETGLIKIGLTKDLRKRMAQVGEKVDVLAAVDLAGSADRDLETKLHFRFRALSMFGEWFKDDGSISQLIELLLDTGIAMAPTDAIDWSEFCVALKIRSSRERNNRAIEDAFMAEIRAAAIKRARARKLARIVEEENEVREMEMAEAC